jgi:hypothetical protein
VTRKTSIEAYNQIKANGLLSALQFSIYAKLFDCGPMTQGELWNTYFQHMQRHSVAPRFAELKDRGVVMEVGERPCRVTGVSALVWDVTDRLPSAIAPKIGPAKESDPLLVRILAKVDYLESKIKELENKQFEPSGQGTFALRNH